ncbi:MAG: hypothetical protein PHZ26_00840 [Candidatus Gracilibacteria bacterium]|nr:hypothetical protein [Candidatus Gracilibacteria bacterium]MDD2908281.1 hypothetical protein [Candidatus Gracilibacteria bacterium]
MNILGDGEVIINQENNNLNDLNKEFYELAIIISNAGQIYKKHFGEKILGEDNIDENIIISFLGEMIQFLSAYGEQYCFDWEYILMNANIHLNKGKLKASSFCCSCMLAELIEKSNSLESTSTEIKGENNIENTWIFLLKHVEKYNNFDFREEHFKYNLLDNYPNEVKVLKKIVELYGAYFTLRDENEEAYKAYEVNTPGKMKEFNSNFVELYQNTEGYFSSKTKKIDIEDKKEAIKTNDFQKLVNLIGQHTKRYFLEFYLKNKIITDSYFIYLNSLTNPWESLKELYYNTVRQNIADNIIKETPNNCIAEVKNKVDLILKRQPKESFRLLTNTEFIIKKYNEYFKTINLGLIGVEVNQLAPQINISKKGDYVVIIDDDYIFNLKRGRINGTGKK